MKIGSPASSQQVQDLRFQRAAQQFEGLLAGELLTPLMKSEEGEGEDGAASQVRQTAVQALATAISAKGGLGITKDLARHLHQEQAKPGIPEKN